MGAFTKVARVDQAKAAEHGMGAPYGRAAPVPELLEAPVDLLRGLFDLVILATRKSSLIGTNFALEVSKTATENKEKRICTSLQ